MFYLLLLLEDWHASYSLFPTMSATDLESKLISFT